MPVPNVLLLVLLLAATAPLASAARTPDEYGRFKGEVVAKFLPDGRNMQLQNAFGYVDPRGRHWDVPAGATTDGASFPRFFWVAFPPFTGKYRAAAVVHDYYCRTRTRTWRHTHEAFYHALRAAGVSEATAKAMYGAVYNFGPRWGPGSSQRGPSADKYRTEAQQLVFFRELEAWIEKENPTPQAIAKRLDEYGEAPRRM